jgi:hypothetical protein
VQRQMLIGAVELLAICAIIFGLGFLVGAR